MPDAGVTPAFFVVQFIVFFLPRACCRGHCKNFRRLRLRLTVTSLSAESRRVRRATPCCRRRRMTVCVQVWILQTLSAVVSRFLGQNTLLLCLHVRRSGLCCQPDPPVLLTGSVVRISARGITYLCISHCLRPFRSDDSPIRRIGRYETCHPRYAQVIGVRRSAVFQWKPGIGIAASSYSPLRRRGILSAPPSVSPVQPRHTCSRPRVEVGHSYSPLQLDDYTVVI